jgi:hypothetical protein
MILSFNENRVGNREIQVKVVGNPFRTDFQRKQRAVPTATMSNAKSMMIQG